jgi:hypothetical protein
MIDTEFAAHLAAAPIAGLLGGMACITLDVVNKPLMVVVIIGAFILHTGLADIIQAVIQIVQQLISERSH